jgi:stage II sporulation protein D
LFSVTTEGDNFEVIGRGYGHGIGLSQWGTQYLASQGIAYDRILLHYYQNAELTQIPENS